MVKDCPTTSKNYDIQNKSDLAANIYKKCIVVRDEVNQIIHMPDISVQQVLQKNIKNAWYVFYSAIPYLNNTDGKTNLVDLQKAINGIMHSVPVEYQTASFKELQTHVDNLVNSINSGKIVIETPSTCKLKEQLETHDIPENLCVLVKTICQKCEQNQKER